MKIDLRFHKKDSGRRKNGAVSEMIRGVSQEQIDQLRGTSKHGTAGSITVQKIQDYYAQVGITITKDEAKDIREAVYNFSDYSYTEMRDALTKERNGETLDASEKEYLRQYNLCMEYTKVAPTYKNHLLTDVYRGIEDHGDGYIQKLLSLNPGDKFDLDKMPSSFTTSLKTARDFAGSIWSAGTPSVIIHVPIKSLKNSTSIKGLAKHPTENEVLIGDYKWRVAKTEKSSSYINETHMYLEEDI
ncbi:MAG: hypothetical protein IJP96_06980 [Synergistaceae bacterium]|nr:hypothetical protein [Synergistaceae bacterium]